MRRHPRPTAYGGQAVIEGVMIRGARNIAVAVRRPDGHIAQRSQRLGRLYSGSARRVPLLRGVIALWETLALGFGALTWSAAIASGEAAAEADANGRSPGAPGAEPSLGLLGWGVLGVSLAAGVALFFALPVLATAWLDGVFPAGWMVVLTEGLLRVALLLGYLWAIGRAEDVQRVFQYHGAEHMAIHAFEHGALAEASGSKIPIVRRFDRAHPRCGTSFLLSVALIAVVVFVLLGTPPLWWRLASRVLLVPVIAALAYEAIRWAGFHSGSPLTRWLFAGNLALQRLTTREPDDEQIFVAITALERAIAEDGRTS